MKSALVYGVGDIERMILPFIPASRYLRLPEILPPDDPPDLIILTTKIERTEEEYVRRAATSYEQSA
jgi:hypothetical protein